MKGRTTLNVSRTILGFRELRRSRTTPGRAGRTQSLRIVRARLTVASIGGRPGPPGFPFSNLATDGLSHGVSRKRRVKTLPVFPRFPAVFGLPAEGGQIVPCRPNPCQRGVEGTSCVSGQLPRLRLSFRLSRAFKTPHAIGRGCSSPRSIKADRNCGTPLERVRARSGSGTSNPVPVARARRR